MKNKQYKDIPDFKSEKEEREFWANHDSAEYVDWNKALVNPTLPNLKPSTETISLRMPEYLLDRIKEIANSRDIPYQSLMKVFLAERVKREHKPL